MAASYAGIRLCLLPEDYRQWLEQWHALTDFQEAQLWDFSSTGLDHLPVPPQPIVGEPPLETLVWPTGASRCAYYHCLIDDVGLALINTALGTTAGPADLVLSDGTGQSRTFSLYKIAARPLSQIVGQGQMYLMTLVDQRWFLRAKTGSVTSEPASWTSLFSTLASALGITLTPDSIDADYGTPTAAWVLSEKPLTLLLDAACNRIGHRLVANLDGTFSTVSYATASTAAGVFTALLTKTAGGLIAATDLVRSVPASVKTVFRNVSTPETPHTVTTSLASLALTEYGAFTGVAGQTATVYGETVYTGSNAAACASYSTQAATDWYKWNLINLDLTYPGITEWEPTGAEDRIEWKYQTGGRILTRVLRSPFQVLLGGTADLDSPVTYGCNLTVDEDGVVSVDVTSLAGDGLTVNSTGDCPKLEVATGCGLGIDGDGAVAFDAATVAGDGLAISDTCTLNVAPGCGIQISGGAVAVNAATLAGNGLGVTGTCTLFVNTGCGLDLSGDAVRLNLTDVALDGLIWNQSNCTLTADWGCGLTLVGNELQVDYDQLVNDATLTSLVKVDLGMGVCPAIGFDRTPFSTTTETLVNDLSVVRDCCNLIISKTRTTYTNHFNQAGVIIDRTAGAPATDTYTTDFCNFVACCVADDLAVTIAGDPVYGLPSLAVDFESNVTGGVGPFTYSWKIGGVEFSTSANPSHTFSTPGKYVVTCTVTDSCDCDPVTATTHVYVLYSTCACPTYPDGVPARYHTVAAVAGGSGDFTGANGDWTFYHTGACEWTGDLGVWQGDITIAGTGSLMEVTLSNGGTFVKWDSGAHDPCDLFNDLFETTYSGTGTRPTAPDVTAIGDCGPCCTTYTSAGSHTFTPDATGDYTVEVIGGGGGGGVGGTILTFGGGGGGGGGYAKSTVAMTSGVGVSLTVGAGGGVGSAGGSTTVGSVSATGGGYGQPAGSGGAGGAGGTGTGTVTHTGGTGGTGSGSTGGGGGASAGTAANGNNGSGGTGGSAPTGGGAGGAGHATGNGTAGSAPGGGGGGGGADGGNPQGAAGAAGWVRICKTF